MDQAKFLLGADAVHVPFNYVRQEVDSTHGLILGQELGVALAFNSTKSHVLVKGDMFFRPHLVIESDHCRGMGAAAIITSGSFSHIQEWLDNGNVLLKKDLPSKKCSLGGLYG